MKRKVTFGRLLLFFIKAYFLIGLVYAFSGYAKDLIAKRIPVFSPLIGIPLDTLGWPWNMRGAYLNGFLDAQFFVTLAAILIALILFLRMLFIKIDGR